MEAERLRAEWCVDALAGVEFFGVDPVDAERIRAEELDEELVAKGLEVCFLFDGECDVLFALGISLAFHLLALLRNGEIGSSQSFSCVPCLFPTRCVAVRVGDPACSSLEPCVAFTVCFGRDAAKILPRDFDFPEFLVIVSCARRQQNGYKENLRLSRLMQLYPTPTPHLPPPSLP